MDNENRGLIPLGDLGSFSFFQEAGLTQRQIGQIDRSSKTFLKDHKLNGSYDMLVKTMPVVRRCMEEGLVEMKGSDKIEPADDLGRAFRSGYEKRKKLVKEVEKEFSPPGFNPSMGELAIPQELSDACKEELVIRATQVNLPRVQRFQSEIHKRRPIFNSLYKAARNIVNERIPGSESVEIDNLQRAGLVRNLLFNWAVSGELNPLFETEYLTNNAKNYLLSIAETPDLWKELADQTGLDYSLAGEYLDQFGQQIAILLQKVASGGRSLEGLGNAYNELKPYFLINDPFAKLPELSENPNDKGSSIWDDDKSFILDISGTKYRVPRIDTLEGLAIRYKTTNLADESRVKHAVEVIKDFLKDLPLGDQAEQQVVNRIAELTSELNNLPTSAENLTIDPKFLLPEKQVQEAVSRHLDLIEDEKNIFPVLADLAKFERELAIDLLKKYQNGGEVDPEDVSLIAGVRLSSRFMLTRVKHFFEHSKRRIRKFERVYAYRNIFEGPMSEMEYHILEKYYQEAKETTVLDILTIRHNHWVGELLGQNIQLTPEENRRIWQLCATAESNYIWNTLYVRAHEYSRKTEKYLSQQARDQHAHRLVAYHREDLLEGPNDPLILRIDTYNQYKKQVNEGQQPNMDVLPDSIYDRWSSEAENVFKDAWWQCRERPAFTTLASILASPNSVRPQLVVDYLTMHVGDNAKMQIFEKISQDTSRAIPFLLESLIYLTPELWPTQHVSLDQILHGIIIDPWMNPLSKTTEQLAEESAQREQNRDRFYGLLSKRGLRWKKQDFDRLVPVSLVGGDRATFAKYIGTFFGIQPEVEAWLQGVEDKLKKQQQAQPKLIKQKMTTTRRWYRDEITAEQAKLIRIKEQNRNRNSGYIKQLYQYNLIRQEPVSDGSDITRDQLELKKPKEHGIL